MLHSVAEQTLLRSGEAMMKEMQVGEGVGLPSQHVRFDFIDCVPSRSRPEAADCLPAGSFIDFGRSANMELWICFEFQFSRNVVVYLSSADPEFWISVEVCKAFFEIVGGEA